MIIRQKFICVAITADSPNLLNNQPLRSVPAGTVMDMVSVLIATWYSVDENGTPLALFNEKEVISFDCESVVGGGGGVDVAPSLLHPAITNNTNKRKKDSFILVE